jgi:hypothetical protein
MNSIKAFRSRSKTSENRATPLGAVVLRALLILVLFSTLTVQSAFSQGAPASPMPTWTKHVVDGPPNYLNMTDRSLSFNPLTGAPCVAYGGDHLYYSCYNATSLSWDTVVVDPDPGVGQYTALAFYREGVLMGRPVISYYDAYNARLKMAAFNGAAWQIFVVPDVSALYGCEIPNPAPPLDPAMEIPAPAETPQETVTPAVPVSETPAISSTVETPVPAMPQAPLSVPGDPNWVDPDASLKPDFDIGTKKGYGKYSSIAIDELGIVHMSYHDELNGALEYQTYNGVSFSGAVLDYYHDQGDAGVYSSIAVYLDANLNTYIHIAYMSDKYDDLKYVMIAKTTAHCFKQTVDGLGQSGENLKRGSFPSIAVDYLGIPYIAYQAFDTVGSYDLMIARKVAWAPPNQGSGWKVKVLDGAGNMGWFASLAITIDKTPANQVFHLSYYNATGMDLIYMRGVNVTNASGWGGTWTKMILEGGVDAPPTGRFTSMAIDWGGKPGVSYLNTSDGTLRFRHRPANTWTGAYIVNSNSHDVGIGSSLAIDAVGDLFMSYVDVSIGNLKYARSMAGSFMNKVVVTSPHSGLYTSIDLYTTGGPAVAFNINDVITENNKSKIIRYFSYGTPSSPYWYVQNVDRTHAVGEFVSMEIDSLNVPHVSYYDATTTNLIYATVQTLVTPNYWYTQTIGANVNTVGWYSSLALNSAGQSHVTYYQENDGSLRLAYQTPTFAWDKLVYPVDSVGVLSGTGVGWYASIDIDNLGRPNISYFDTVNQDLKFATWNGAWPPASPYTSDWSITTIDSVGDVGRYSSLVIDPLTGTRHICYYDRTNGNLKYARWEGAGWETAVVDGSLADGDAFDEGDVGYYCSIDLNSLGQPAISYYDNTNGDLKAAISYALPPMASGVRIFLPLMRR